MRVSVLIADTPLDLDVPAHLEIGLLIPMLWDIAAVTLPKLPRFELPLARELHQPGRAALDPGSTLSGSDIRDGDILVLTARAPVDAVPGSVDPAVGFTLDSPGTSQMVPRSVTGVAVIMLAAVAGITALPDRPAVETLLLTAGVTAAAAAVTARLHNSASVVLHAIVLSGVLGVGTAIVVLAAGGELSDCGVLMATAATGLLSCVGTIAVIFSETALFAASAPLTLDTMIGACAVSAGIAVPLMCVGAFDWPRGALAVAVSALLALRARAPGAVFGRSTLVLAAAISAATVLTTAPVQVPVISALALGAAGQTAWFSSPSRRRSALARRRTADITERLLLAAVLPLCCWAFGIYGLVR